VLIHRAIKQLQEMLDEDASGAPLAEASDDNSNDPARDSLDAHQQAPRR